jgi:hypothetical protein
MNVKKLVSVLKKKGAPKELIDEAKHLNTLNDQTFSEYMGAVIIVKIMRAQNMGDKDIAKELAKAGKMGEIYRASKLFAKGGKKLKAWLTVAEASWEVSVK